MNFKPEIREQLLEEANFLWALGSVQDFVGYNTAREGSFSYHADYENRSDRMYWWCELSWAKHYSHGKVVVKRGDSPLEAYEAAMAEWKRNPNT